MRQIISKVILNNKKSIGIGEPVEVLDFKFKDIMIATQGKAVIKCQASFEKCDFMSPSSLQNQWSYIHLVDMNSGAPIDGEIGAVLKSGVRYFAVNAEGFRFLNLEVAEVEGSVTALAYLYNEINPARI